MSQLPIAHGANGFATGHAKARPPYDWEDDARRCYTLACELIGERLIRQRIIAALKRRARQ